MILDQLGQAQGLAWTLGQTQPAQIQPLLQNCLLILLAYLGLAGLSGMLSSIFRNYSYGRISYLRLDYLRDLMTCQLNMDYHYVEDASFNDHMQRVMDAVSGDNSGIQMVYRQAFLLPADLLGSLVLLLILAQTKPWLPLLPIFSLLALFWARYQSGKLRYDLRDQTSKANRKRHRYTSLAQDFSYGKDIRLFDLSDMVLSYYQQVLRDYLDLLRQIAKREFHFNQFPLLIRLSSTGISLGILLRLALSGSINSANFAFYLTAYIGLMQLLDQMASKLSIIVSEGRYVQEFLDFMDQDLEAESGNQLLLTNADIEVEFRDVSFHYPGSEKMVLDHLNLTLHAGEKLALVGVNGAGKSTLVRLMTGLFTPSSGQVLINGIDTRDLDRTSLFKAFSVVFQSEKPLAITVAQQLAGSLDEINLTKVEAVLRETGLWDKVAASPQGMDSNLLKVIDPEGLMLSGGESQKLMLARALYKDAPAFILDEPTSALDALAESQLYQEFARVLENKTGLFISHRLASTSFCDRIVLLSQGTIAEVGTHEDLMSAGGLYYQMFTTQGKYYQASPEEAGK
ncbi:MAG: ABC transporter ATP-binding protein [Clostridiales bacterium]|nr:ABC transporter ATP-binding protein [Clostridiales bacterium]